MSRLIQEDVLLKILDHNEQIKLLNGQFKPMSLPFTEKEQRKVYDYSRRY